MSEIVFILGAGASRLAGAPLMRDFLDSAEDLLKKGLVQGAEDDFNLVFRGFDALKLAAAKAQMDFENIESVFAAFEMAKLLGRLDGLSTEELNNLPKAMRSIIVKTLEESITGGVTGGAGLKQSSLVRVNKAFKFPYEQPCPGCRG